MKIVFANNNLTEMARIGFTDDMYEIYINTDDPGNIPHFHYRKANEWDKFHTCIKIATAEYFHHTGKEDVLNSKQRKELVKFLSSKNETIENLTNYQYVIASWNSNNSSKKIPLDTEMPDYLNLR